MSSFGAAPRGRRSSIKHITCNANAEPTMTSHDGSCACTCGAKPSNASGKRFSGPMNHSPSSARPSGPTEAQKMPTPPTLGTSRSAFSWPLPPVVSSNRARAPNTMSMRTSSAETTNAPAVARTIAARTHQRLSVSSVRASLHPWTWGGHSSWLHYASCGRHWYRVCLCKR